MVKVEAGAPSKHTIGRALDGRYRLEAEIGAGGLGAVYRATHEKLDRSVAVKLLHQHCGESELLRGRFEREARALATLDHPNIVSITDFGISEDTPYLVMELLEGETLAERLDRGPLAASDAPRVFKELLAALRFVHERGLVHRDVKPSNVFLQRLSSGGERVKILDFGLAKFMAADDPQERHDPILTRAGAVVGTPAYMSPEQASGDSADARSDVYAAGVILFQMLTGRLPFEGDAIDQLRSHLVAPLPKLNDVQHTRVIRPELDVFLERATAKRREERFDNAGAMLTAIEALPEPWLVSERTPIHTTLATASTQPLSTTASERLAAQSAQPNTPLAASESAQPRRSFWTLGTQLIAITLFAGLASLAVFGAQRAGLWDRPLRSETRHAKPLQPKVATPAPEPTAARPPEIQAAVADAVGGLEPVLQRAREDELPLQQEFAEHELAPPLPAANPNQPRPPARNPWARGALPKQLRELRKAIVSGARGSDRTVLGLRRYNREHVTDPRGHLLLAGLYLNREWRADAIHQFSIAYQRDATSRGAPEMLPALVACLVQGQAAAEAEKLVVGAFGAEALPALDRALRAHNTDPRVVARLRAVRDRLRGG